MNKLFLPALLSVALGLSACGGGGTAGTPPVVVTTPTIQAAVNARYQLVLKDIATDAPITDPLVLTFSGTAAVQAADGTTLTGKSVTVTTGFYPVNAVFNTTGDSFTVKVADGGTKGWVASSITITGEAAATGDRLVEVKLLNPNNAAQINASTAPVTVASQTTTVAANGSLTAPVSVTTPAKTVTAADGTTAQLPTTKLTMTTGTIGTTASGAPAAAGPMTVAATTFSSANAESLQAFPGGFAPAVSSTNSAVLNGLSTSDVSMSPAAFADFTVKDSAGNAITNFSQPITVSMDIPKSTLDANGNPVKAGSQFPIWSFDQAAQTWKFETMGNVAEKSPVDPTFFSVSFQTSHLSWWTAAVLHSTCNTTVTISGRPTGDNRTLTVDIVGSAATSFYATGTTKGNVVSFTKLVNNSTGTITVSDGSTVVGQLKNASICSGVTVPVGLQSAPSASVRFETSASCPDGSHVTPVPTYVNIVQGPAQGTDYFPGYTNIVDSNTNVETVTMSGLPSGVVTANAFDPYAKQWVPQAVTLTAGATTTVSFKFGLKCQQGTGGSFIVNPNP
jgi:hypothetical protein